MYNSIETIDWTQIEPLKEISFEGSIVADSRKVKAGDVFIAYPGLHHDGRDYINSAINNGAVAIIYDSSDDFKIQNNRVEHYAVKNLPRLVGIIAAVMYHNTNNHELKVIGVTGTNGKTSITHWLAQALAELGEKSALIGTNGYGEWGNLTATNNTTPDAVTLQNLILELKNKHMRVLSMEVSSHGIEQGRINGIEFDSAVFTNLTRDHLDYHHDMNHYFDAKEKLFFWHNLKHAVINIDDMYGQQLTKDVITHNPELKITTYGFSSSALVRIEKLNYSFEGMHLVLKTPVGLISINNSLIGDFNALNVAAAVSVLIYMGYSNELIAKVMSNIQAAKGRMQTLRNPNQPMVIVDYAHTPDALQNVLQSCATTIDVPGKIWCVFGCGGDRDPGKRAMMGQVAAQFADFSVVTSDNPRSENPMSIIDSILPVENAIKVEIDREQAIAFAIKQAQRGDIVVIAGKGHEDYQEINGVKHHFDDADIAKKYLEQ